jgi:3-isopropylmalate/(R)-2-methylmalate dehydratase small subunit
VAESWARICYRNSINGGYLAPLECAERICDRISTGDEVEIDLEGGVLRDLTTGAEFPLRPLGDAAEIVATGGLFDYARRTGMLPG